MQNIKILVPADLSFSSGVREIAQEAARRAGFERKQTNMVRLVIDELFMNAVRYGSKEKSHVFFEIIIEESQLICAIEDEGKGEHKVTADELKNIIQKETDNVSLNKAHGRGLAQITSTLVQAFEITDKENGGLRIEFVIKKQLSEDKKSSVSLEESQKILPEAELKISGEVDLNNIEEVSENIEKLFSEKKDIPFCLILDFSELRYCNSTFLGSLAAWQSVLSERGGEGLIKNPTAEIFEILDLVGLTSIYRVEHSKGGEKSKKEEGEGKSEFHKVD
ncbi:STAS domain-containing protein [Candidatus Peregrinibacteria bacterium]|jgi:anti-anti-sigma factor|nr:STAS domain-containing protein [Candidatus Peregrinibacteria bacterium]